MSTQIPFGSGCGYVNRFCGPASDGRDRVRYEVYTDARGMDRNDVLALIGTLTRSLIEYPAPVAALETELKFANDTAEMLLGVVPYVPFYYSGIGPDRQEWCCECVPAFRQVNPLTPLRPIERSAEATCDQCGRYRREA